MKVIYYVMDVKDEMKLLSFVMYRARKKTLLSLYKGMKSPSMIAKETNLSLGNMWRVLENLEEKGLIICLNKEEHHFKMYQLTDLGKKLTKQIKEIEESKT